MTTTREPGVERTIGQLVADATHDISSIVHNEIALAKTELKDDAKAAAKGAGMFGAAAFLGVLGLIFLFHTVALVIHIWLPISASYGITTALLFIVAGVLALVGKKSVQGVKGKPERTIRNAQETISTVKSGS
jgi:protein-S-isoprenylcysteine O-methyltransferase Ste14